MTLLIDPRWHDAVLFDLDGVVTDTAAVHAQAWRELFDAFLAERARDPDRVGDPDRAGEEHRPFTTEDYLRHVDGKRRHEGVLSFLASRRIALPAGAATDPPGSGTAHALGAAKDERFRQILARDGVRPFASTLTLLRQLREAGIATAIFSASRNCRAVLAAAGAEELFTVRVDGVLADELGLASKPDPAMLLAAAERLGVPPRRCVVVEDAEAGVAAGRGGGFALVVGVERHGRGDALAGAGAHVVVTDLAEATVRPRPPRMSVLPNALAVWPQLAAAIAERPVALCCDFDGTLSPIVAEPGAAELAGGMAPVLTEIARYCPVAIVSGRDLADVRQRVELPGLWYAGSHGVELSGPDGQRFEHPEAAAAVPALARVEALLRQALAHVPGVRVERKRFALAVHHRLVAVERVPQVVTAVTDAVAAVAGLRLTHGRMVTEIRPDLEWDKGRAVRWLLEQLPGGGDTLAVYAGDDVTDEDALAEVATTGVGVVVRHGETGDRDSAAHVAVDDPEQLRQLLTALATHLAGDHAGRVSR